jgi:subtilisin family serine protease
MNPDIIRNLVLVVAVMIVTAAATSWGIDRINQNDLPLDNNYARSFSGQNVNVYVLDTGIDTTHSEFTANQPLTRTEENIYVVSGLGTLSTNTDGDGHGTHCAGTVGGATIGVSQGANIYGLKVLSDSGSGSTSGIISALDFVKTHLAASGGKRGVVSMSLGGACSSNCQSDSLVIAVNNIVATGVVAAIAAGK